MPMQSVSVDGLNPPLSEPELELIPTNYLALVTAAASADPNLLIYLKPPIFGVPGTPIVNV